MNFLMLKFPYNGIMTLDFYLKFEVYATTNQIGRITYGKMGIFI